MSAEAAVDRALARCRRGWTVQLMEIALSRHEEEIYLRNSETVRRMFLFCANTACDEWERVVVASTDVRLR